MDLACPRPERDENGLYADDAYVQLPDRPSRYALIVRIANIAELQRIDPFCQLPLVSELGTRLVAIADDGRATVTGSRLAFVAEVSRSLTEAEHALLTEPVISLFSNEPLPTEFDIEVRELDEAVTRASLLEQLRDELPPLLWER